MPMDMVAPPDHPRWHRESRSEHIKAIELKQLLDYQKELDRHHAVAMYQARLRVDEYEEAEEKFWGRMGIFLAVLFFGGFILGMTNN